ncbi:MAG: hypothetical protein DDT23_00764 [candidate division WS2 bacterium]|nr:hypothetical protein [Candidatus Lithacetigena glycinireducens]
MSNNYFDLVVGHLNKLNLSQKPVIEQAAEIISQALEKGGILHVFGCGHSQLLVSELFYRAGGLVTINPIIEQPLSPGGGKKSSWFERQPGYAKIILDSYQTREDEPILIISNSGINIVPVEMALNARDRKLKIIALTSSQYKEVPSRHPSGKKLIDLADVVIDNGIPQGDAVIDIPGYNIKVSPLSGVVGIALLWSLITEIALKLAEKGIKPPIWVSGNIPGGDEANQKYYQQYRERIKLL